MFSGIIEASGKVIQSSIKRQKDSITFCISKPTTFDDLRIGDSVSVNGTCLTVEAFDADSIQFTFGAETLKVLGPSIENYFTKDLNLERSLKYGDRVHGPLVTGHVEAVWRIEYLVNEGSSLLIQVRVPDSIQKNIWSKGSIAINGVSLTINFIDQNKLGVCLIPETLRKTNLSQYSAGDLINVETDYYAKVIYQKGV